MAGRQKALPSLPKSLKGLLHSQQGAAQINKGQNEKVRRYLKLSHHLLLFISLRGILAASYMPVISSCQLASYSAQNQANGINIFRAKGAFFINGICTTMCIIVKPYTSQVIKFKIS